MTAPHSDRVPTRTENEPAHKWLLRVLVWAFGRFVVFKTTARSTRAILARGGLALTLIGATAAVGGLKWETIWNIIVSLIQSGELLPADDDPWAAIPGLVVMAFGIIVIVLGRLSSEKNTPHTTVKIEPMADLAAERWSVARIDGGFQGAINEIIKIKDGFGAASFAIPIAKDLRISVRELAEDENEKEFRPLLKKLDQFITAAIDSRSVGADEKNPAAIAAGELVNEFNRVEARWEAGHCNHLTM